MQLSPLLSLLLVTPHLLFTVATPAPIAFTASSNLAGDPPQSLDLDSALARASNTSAAVITLLRGERAFMLSTTVSIASEVSIEGAQQTVLMNGRVVVEELGVVQIANARLIANESMSELKVVFEVKGRVVIQDCSLEEFVRLGFDLSGELEIRTSTASRNREALVSMSSGGVLALRRFALSEHTGLFVSVNQQARATTPTTIVLSECTFQDNFARSNDRLFAVFTTAFGGTFIVDSSRFINNFSPLFYFDVANFTIEFGASQFSSNDRGVMVAHAISTLVKIQSCIAIRNAEILIDVRQLQGDFLLENVTITDQRRSGVIRVSSTLSTENCHFTAKNSSFSDIQVSTSGTTSGAFTFSSCLAYISNVSVKNVSISTANARDVVGLIYIEYGAMSIDALYLNNSGSSGVTVGAQYGELSITNSMFVNPLSDVDFYLGSTLGRFTIYNVTIVDGARINHNLGSIGTGGNVCIGIALVTAVIQKLTVVQVEPNPYRDNVFSVTASTFEISDIKLDDIILYGISNMVSSSGSISNISIKNCTTGGYVFWFSLHSVLQIRNLRMEGSNNSDFLHGVFGLSRNSSFHAQNLLLTNLKQMTLVKGKISKIHIVNVTIAQCTFYNLVHYPIQSSIKIEGLNYTHSIGGIVMGSESEFALVDSNVESIASERYLIAGEKTKIVLSGVSFRSLKSVQHVGRLQIDSQLTIFNSSIQGMESDTGVGFSIIDGSVNITQSVVTNFHVSLVQASTSSVAFVDSVFKNGRNPILTLKSGIAYGGVLGCLDCLEVLLSGVTAYNVTAKVGGAIAIRARENAEEHSFQVRNSSFLLCSGNSGGALMILNASFHIDSSIFISNTAATTGGAIDVSIPLSKGGKISHCTFSRNSAVEGGAIKWKNAQIDLKQVAFVENSASYGPDIASYPASLSSALTDIKGSAVSGAPLSIAFELLDHYGQRVTTAANKAFRLVSTSMISFRGNEVSLCNNGVFNFSELTIYAPPNSSQVISGVMEDFQEKLSRSLKGDVSVTFRECVVGEIWKSDRCEYCYPGNVSYSVYDKECQFCPGNAFCLGGTALLVNPHYWRTAWNSTTLHKCPLEDKCLGGTSSACAEGFAGLLCNQCADGYYHFRSIECESCGNRQAVVVQILVIALLLCAFVVFILMFAVRKRSTAKLYSLKMILHHAQFLTAMCPLKVSYSDIVRDSLHGVTYISSLLIADMPIACVDNSAPEYVRAIIGSLLLPTLILLYAAMTWPFTKSWRSNIAILTTSSLLFTPIVVMNVLIPLLACEKVGSEGEWLFVDMSQRCWTDSHQSLIYGILLPSVLFNVVLPISSLVFIAWKYPATFEKYFPLWTSGYKWHSWDLFLTLSKVVSFGLLFASLAYDKLSQLTYGLVTLTITCVLNVSFRDKAFLNYKYFLLSEASLLVAIISMGLGGYSIYYHPSESVSDYFVSAVFVVLNCGFFMVAPFVKFRVKREEIEGFEMRLASEDEGMKAGVPPNSIVDVLREGAGVHSKSSI